MFAVEFKAELTFEKRLKNRVTLDKGLKKRVTSNKRLKQWVVLEKRLKKRVTSNKRLKRVGCILDGLKWLGVEAIGDEINGILQIFLK